MRLTFAYSAGNGFTDIARLQSDSIFSRLNTSDEFKEVCKKINDAKTAEGK